MLQFRLISLKHQTIYHHKTAIVQKLSYETVGHKVRVFKVLDTDAQNTVGALVSILW